MNTKQIERKILEVRAKLERVNRDLAEASGKLPGHIDDYDLERYHLGMVTDEAELAPLEKHLLCCAACVDRAEATALYVDAIRAAAFDSAPAVK